MATSKAAWSLVLLTLLVLFGATAVNASPGQCSLATLKGSYGFLEQGMILIPLPDVPVQPPFPYAAIGIANFDGGGNVSGTYTASFGGSIVSDTFSGTYLVNLDCTYTLQFTPSLFPGTQHHIGSISGNGMVQEVRYIYTDANLVVSGVGDKTPLGGCSVGTLKGNYTVQGQGTNLFAPIPGFPVAPPFPMGHIGQLTFDGLGKFSGQGTENVAGISFGNTFTATYRVNSTCAVSITIADTALGFTMTIPESGVITGQGQQQTLWTIINAPGLVFAETYSTH